MTTTTTTTTTTILKIIIIVITGVSAAIDSIVPHAFGEHSKCGQWCQFRKDEKAKHKSLPHGLDLKGDTLQTELSSIFKIFSQNAGKLAPCGSTLANESFNNSVYHWGRSRCELQRQNIAGQKIQVITCVEQCIVLKRTRQELLTTM